MRRLFLRKKKSNSLQFLPILKCVYDWNCNIYMNVDMMYDLLSLPGKKSYQEFAIFNTPYIVSRCLLLREWLSVLPSLMATRFLLTKQNKKSRHLKKRRK